MITRRNLIIAAINASCLLLPFGAVKAQEQPPNIIVILADDLGNADLGYRGSDIRTPNIDKLAKEGVQLESFHGMPVCTPARRADDRPIPDALRPSNPGDISEPHLRAAD